MDKGKLESCRCNEILELGHLLPPIAFRRPAIRHGAGRGSTELACAGGGRARLPRGRGRGGGKGEELQRKAAEPEKIKEIQWPEN